MTTKPLLFLDVDGVVNAFSPVRPHSVHLLGGREVKGVFRPYTINFDNDVVAMIEALSEHFDITWFTMWNERANDLIAPALGIEPFPVAYADHNKGWDTALARGTEQWNIHRLWYAKTPLLPEYAQGQPFAWVDDDHSRADLAWLTQQTDSPESFYLHQTNADKGIQWSDVADLIEWAQALARGTHAEVPTWHGSTRIPEWVPLDDDPEPVLWFDDAEYEPIDWESEEIQGFLAALEDESA